VAGGGEPALLESWALGVANVVDVIDGDEQL
jgi:hypothetical protein